MDFTAATMNPSTNVGQSQQLRPARPLGQCTTMFAVDDEDQKVYAYKISDRSRIGQGHRAGYRQRKPGGPVVRRPGPLGRRRHRRQALRLRPAGRAAGQHSCRRRPADQQRVHQGRLQGRCVAGETLTARARSWILSGGGGSYFGSSPRRVRPGRSYVHR